MKSIEFISVDDESSKGVGDTRLWINELDEGFTGAITDGLVFPLIVRGYDMDIVLVIKNYYIPRHEQPLQWDQGWAVA